MLLCTHPPTHTHTHRYIEPFLGYCIHHYLYLAPPITRSLIFFICFVVNNYFGLDVPISQYTKLTTV